MLLFWHEKFDPKEKIQRKTFVHFNETEWKKMCEHFFKLMF